MGREAKDAAEHSAIHRTSFLHYNKNYQAPNVPNAEVENSRTSCIFWSGKYGGRVRLYLMVASAHRHCRELVLPEKSS